MCVYVFDFRIIVIAQTILHSVNLKLVKRVHYEGGIQAKKQD